jgi:hypothetical protein
MTVRFSHRQGAKGRQKRRGGFGMAKMSLLSLAPLGALAVKNRRAYSTVMLPYMPSWMSQ